MVFFSYLFFLNFISFFFCFQVQIHIILEEKQCLTTKMVIQDIHLLLLNLEIFKTKLTVVHLVGSRVLSCVKILLRTFDTKLLTSFIISRSFRCSYLFCVVCISKGPDPYYIYGQKSKAQGMYGFPNSGH